MAYPKEANSPISLPNIRVMSKNLMPISRNIVFFLSLFFSFTSASYGNNATDMQALLAFKASIASDPLHVLSSWNETVHFCSWEGVMCNHNSHKVVSMDLTSLGLVGYLSPFLGNLSFLTSISLKNNRFSGKIPEEIGRLRHLEYVEFSNNSFGGEIPRNLSECTKLYHLNLNVNNLTGSIPEIGSLVRLQALGLALNRLSGTIPPWIGNLTSLNRLSLGSCGLKGQIPESLVQLKNLSFLQLSENSLTGSIPLGLFNSSVLTFAVKSNQLQGRIPPDAGHTLRSITNLDFGDNKFYGEIPVSLLNASSLEVINLGSNNFTGPMLNNFERLTNLQYFLLGENNIQGDVSFMSSLTNCTKLKSFAISNNLLKGSFPNSIANLSKELIYLSMRGNNINGILPIGIGYLLNLAYLILEDNDISGPIPSSIGMLVKLQELSLRENRFTSEIPLSLGNLTLLNRLNLNFNNISGIIPQSFSNFSTLLSLDLSHNSLNGAIPPEILSLSSISIFFSLACNAFTGPIPREVGLLRSLARLDLSNNRLSGTIPIALRGCVSLERLNLQGNSFQGEIPTGLSSLRGLQVLDLSRNHLSGPIPSFLGELHLLNLNLSYNELQGQVPTSGVFQNRSAISVDGNIDLCGGIAELRLQSCTTLNHNNKKFFKVLKITVPAGLAFSILVFFLCVFMTKEKLRRKTHKTSMLRFDDHFMRLSYNDLLKATGGFSKVNLVGVGQFGSVYKGNLDSCKTTVAVKVLNLDVRGASETFMAECNALREVRHRNLVKILSVCISTDFQGRDFKALIYEYKSNGSLEEWLHDNAGTEGWKRKGLTMIQRLNIAIDIASALEYLNYGTNSTIIHGDLKPNNILLDKEMTAYVGDFGLAKVVSSISKEFPINESSSCAIKGTVGYIAPEYGMGETTSIRGDAYSFGILVMEMFTGIRPTSETVKEHPNLNSFVSSALPNALTYILDPLLVQEIELGDGNKAKESMLSVLKIGVACSNEFPGDRMAMADVVRELKKIRSAYGAQRMI